MDEIILYEDRPAMFRSHPIGFVFALVLCPVGIGLIIFLVWWLNVLGTKLTVTEQRTILRRGILSKRLNEVYHSDIRNVRISQSFLQRIFDAGAISIASAGSGMAEIEVAGMREPMQIKMILDQGRREKTTNE